MRKLIFPFLLLISVSSIYANPNFTVGSNSFYTVFGFPHDLLKWPNKAVFGYMYPQTMPWQGHVTNITERPNDTYISNYNNFDFPVPDGYSGNPTAIHSYLQLSYEYGDHKSAIRYRRNSESGQYYYWRSNLADSLAGANFNGTYVTDLRYEDAIANDLIRAYSKIRFWKIGDVDMGLLFFLQYVDRDKSTVSSNKDLDSEPLSSDLENEYSIEINPWLNYKFGKSYFDFGLLCEVSYNIMENTSPRWNSVTGATQKDVIRDSSPYESGFSPSWETFSQGSYLFFATGFEASTGINLGGRFSVLASVLMLRKYSFITKEYGRSEIPVGSSTYGFQESHTRNDDKVETWMTGSIGFAYGWGPIQTIATMQLPLAWLLVKNTKVTNSNTTFVDLTQKNVWAVQEPISFRLLLIFGLER
jgi:hypothetical protein